MTCFLTVRVLRMKTLVVVYDPPRTPLLGLLGPLAPFFLLQPLCGGDISTTVSAYSRNTGIMVGDGGQVFPGDLRSGFFLRFNEISSQIREPITILHCNTSIMMKNCTKSC